MSEQQNEIGDNIASLRKENNMSQESLAEKLNVSRQAVSNWERNKTQPDISIIAKICGLFGTNIDDLVRGEYVMITGKKKDKSVQNEEELNKYDMAIGLFYAVSLFIALGGSVIVGLIFNSTKIWIISGIGGTFLFLSLGLLSHAIITLVRKDIK